MSKDDEACPPGQYADPGLLSMGNPPPDQGRSDIEVDETHPTPGQPEDQAPFGGQVTSGDGHSERNQHDDGCDKSKNSGSRHLPRLGEVGRDW